MKVASDGRFTRTARASLGGLQDGSDRGLRITGTLPQGPSRRRETGREWEGMGPGTVARRVLTLRLP
jgi:hypothetical protein